jgi:hypothetical protein
MWSRGEAVKDGRVEQAIGDVLIVCWVILDEILAKARHRAALEFDVRSTKKVEVRGCFAR